MTTDEILAELRRLQVPHDRIAAAIGRDRTAATKMLNGARSVKASEVAPLMQLIAEALGELTDGQREAARLRAEREQRRGVVRFARRSALREPGEQGLRLQIRGPVQAGAWLEVNQLDQREPEYHHAVPDPRFPRARQWLSVVRGDSMNALTKGTRPAGILDGDLVHVVDAIDIDYRPVSGDIVEVERSRFDGAEREVTIKQIDIDATGKMLLWPRSTNPAFREPLPLVDDVRDSEGVEVRIRGKVLQVLRSL